jgi:hypothetical protein
VPAPVVNVNNDVAAPVVQVHNEVQPAEVCVTLPNRKTETTVVRDRNGDIVKATQIETDAE